MTGTPAQPDTTAPDGATPPWEAIDRYLAGECSIAEREELERWLRSASGEARAFLNLRDALGASRVTSAEVADAARRAEMILRRGDAPRSEMRKSAGWGASILPRGVFTRWGLGRSATIAAVAVVMFILGGIGVARIRTREAVSPRAEVRTYATGDNQIASITLADSTRVTLAPHSTLRVVKDFSARRDVELRGRAYFEVIQADGKPFVIRTGTIATRVLGTAFDVRHYSADTDVRVAVMSGKVAVSGPRTPVTLAAGTVGLITDSTANITRPDDLQSSLQWTKGRLVFTETPVLEVLKTVGDWYGVRFRLADSALVARQIRLTLTLDHITRTETIGVLESLLGVAMTIDDHDSANPTITIRMRRRVGREFRSKEQSQFSIPRGVGR